MKKTCLFGLLWIGLLSICAGAVVRPNILWITLEDMSPDLGCYGDSYSVSPNIDKLATQGIRYTRAWSNAGMCSPARATLISGMYPPSTGAQNMRSEVLLPDNVLGFPEYLRKAGYFCSNHSKTDYNWKQPASTWDVIDKDWKKKGWRNRKPGQPFFTVINIMDTHSSQLYYRGEENWKRRIQSLSTEERHDPAKVKVPPYYPDVTEVRGDLARYYDNITYADKIVGEILAQLEADGLADDTIVFFYSDHGRGMPRTKGWCFQTSLQVPFIIRFPERYQDLAPGKPGSDDNRLVSFVDFAPTVLSLAKVEIPQHMQGKAFLGEQQQDEREYCFAYRDRMDERIDLIRSVWDGRYKYIRNYMPHLPWFHHQTRDYPSRQPTYLKWHELEAEGKLSAPEALYMAWSKPREQLFDTHADPFEMNNLADSPDHQRHLARLRSTLKSWQMEIVDLGFMPESQWFTRFHLAGDARPRHTIARQSPTQYPLEQVMKVAGWVGGGTKVLNKQVKALSHKDPAVRYWAAIGMLAQEELPVTALEELKPLLDDPVATVQIVAAQILYQHEPSGKVLSCMTRWLEHPEPFVVLSAANAIDHLGEGAMPALPAIESFLKTEPDSNHVGGQLPYWLLKGTVENLTN